MNLTETLKLLALQLQLNPNELTQYAAEDTLGGYSSNESDRKWPIGSLWEQEGKVLYALIRTLKPQHVAEIGSLRGCSTAHIATALSVNGSGRVTSIDIAGGALDMYPKHLDKHLTAVTGDGLEWLAGQEDESIDLLFEDSSHGEDMCASVAALCKTKLTPGGILIVHDAAHFLVGKDVQAGLTRALGNAYRVYLSDPSDCGFAAWQRPGQSIIERVKSATWAIEPEQKAYTADEFAQKLDEIQAEKPAKKKPGRKPKSQTL